MSQEINSQSSDLIQTELSSEVSPVKTSQSLESEQVLKEHGQDSSGKSTDSLKKRKRNGLSSKTSQVSCRLTEEGIWVPSSGRWLSSGMGSLTEFSTRNISESRKDAVECLLSDVLETQGEHLKKYLISSKAAQGIIQRASRRGKTLPDQLMKALLHVSEGLGITK